MKTRSRIDSVDEYIAGFPPNVRQVLEELRALVWAAAPSATERISYAIPTFDLKAKHLIYIAGWKEHIAVYPINDSVAEVFREEIEPYRSGKGSVRFPLGQPVPLDLVRRIVEFRANEITSNGA